MSTETTAPGTAGPLGAVHEPTKTAGELVKRAPLPAAVGKFVLGDDEIRRTWRVSSALAASGMFKDAQQAEVAFAKVLLGRDLGISPTQALMGLDIVKGNVQMRGVLLLSFVRKSRTYDYRVIELDGETEVEDRDLGRREAKQRATLRFFEVAPDGSKEVLTPDITYTMAMARKTGNVKDGSAWMSARRNMLLWRAASDGVKIHCPDLLAGIPVYTEADEFREAPALGDGTGNGQPAGIELGPEVEAVLARAADLGHAGLSDRGTVELVLGDQPPAKVAEWVRAANRELDEVPIDAEVVPEPENGPLSPGGARAAEPEPEPVDGAQAPREAAQTADPEAIAKMRAHALQLADIADGLEADGDHEQAARARDEATTLMAEVDAATDPAQDRMSF